MALVITSCTNRKSRSAPVALQAANLPQGPVERVAAAWAARVGSAGGRTEARRLYQGRSFREAEQAAGAAGARLAVLSAGMGLIMADARVPSYSLTVVPEAADNVLGRIATGATPALWWRQIRSAGLGQRLEELTGDDLVLLAAGRAYLEMIAGDVASLSVSARSRVRVFTAVSEGGLPQVYHGLVMPYDDRLDGLDTPRAGTMSDFAQRALHDFVTGILPQDPAGSAREHAAAVLDRLAPWRRRKRHRGTSLGDAEIGALIGRHWQAVGGRSSAMLRFLRGELGIACEQGRFRRLFAAVGAERAA